MDVPAGHAVDAFGALADSYGSSRWAGKPFGCWASGGTLEIVTAQKESDYPWHYIVVSPPLGHVPAPAKLQQGLEEEPAWVPADVADKRNVSTVGGTKGLC